MTRPGALRSRLAVFLCLAFTTSLVLPSLAGPTKPNTNPTMRVAIGECSDATAGAMPGLAALLQRSLYRALAARPGLELVSLESGRAERVLSARIAAVRKPERRAGATVEVVAQATEPVTGRVAYHGTVVAQGAQRPGEEAAASVERAVAQAAEQVAEQAAQTETVRTTVISVRENNRVIIALGTRDGIGRGTEIEIVRDSAVIAKGRVEGAEETKATVQLCEVQPGVHVEITDLVLMTNIVPPTPRKKHRDPWPVVAAVAIAGAILWVALSQNGGGVGGGGGQLLVAPKDSTIPADGISTTTITAMFRDQNGNPPPDSTVVRFQTSLGLIVPAETHFVSGKAEATLTSAPTPGTATISVICGKLRTTTTVGFVAPAS